MEPVNPLKRIRINARYPIDRMSKEFGLSRQAIMNNEAAQYEQPSETYINILKQIKDFSDLEVNELYTEYKKFQLAMRQYNYGVLCEPLPVGYSNVLRGDMFNAATENSKRHPVVDWCEVSNIPYTRLSKLYCLHQGLMDRLKNQHNLMNYLPTMFTSALLDSGYQQSTITELETRFQLFKVTLRAEFEAKNSLKDAGKKAV